MQQHIKIKQYLETVCRQIRLKSVHADIREEIENHIADQKEAFISQGMEEETATVKAVEQMGDPVIVGTELDRTHRPKPEWSIIALTALLLLAGTFIRVYTAPQEDYGITLFNRQLVFTLMGIGLMAFCYYLDFSLLGKFPITAFLSLAAFIILIIVRTNSINGRHIYATYPLLLFPVIYAGIVYRMGNKGYPGIILCGLLFVIPFALSLTIPSVASAIVLVLSCLTILTVAIARNRFGVRRLYALLLVYVPTCSVFLLFINLAHDSLIQRAARHYPFSDAFGSGYMENIIRQLLSGARLTGQGSLSETVGEAVSQLLPGISSDFLLAYSVHRFGWLAFVAVVLLMAIFIIRAFMLCLKQKSFLALLVSMAVTTTIALQTVFYIVANLGLPIFSPLSLPLISQSSSYLLVNMCLVGVLLSVFRTGHLVKDRERGKKAPANRFIKFEDGRLIIDFNPH